MPTDLAWAAVTISFRFNNYLWKTPLQWDPTRRRFLFIPGGVRVFFWWYFVVFGVWIGMCNNSIAYVIIRQILHPKPNVKFVLILIYAIAYVAGWLLAAITLLLAFLGDDTVWHMNRTIELYEDLMDDKLGKRKKQKRMFGNPIPSLLDMDGKLDKAGLTIFLILTPLPFMAWFLAPMSVVLAKNDVLQFVLEDIIPEQIRTHPVINIILVLFRIGLMFILNAESLRTFPFMVFILGIPAQLAIKVVEYFKDLQLTSGTSQAKWNTALKHFTTLRLLYMDCEPELARITFLLMGVGLMLSSGLNFAAIRFIDVEMPLTQYLLFPFLSFVVVGVIVTLLPVAIGVHEVTRNTLIEWKRGVGAKNVQLQKRLQGIRELMFYAGLNGYYFYSLDKDVLSTYIMAILDATTELLMAFPAADLISNISARLSNN